MISKSCSSDICNHHYVLRTALFYLNGISPGSSYPLTRHGAKPVTGDLPITAPSPVTLNLENSYYLLYLNLNVEY